VSAPFPTPGEASTGQRNQTPILDSLPGSASSACAVVGQRSDVRAGSVAVGNFVTARKQYSADARKSKTPTVFLYVIPEHAAHLRTVTVLVEPTGAGSSRTVSSKAIEDADTSRYFTVNLPVPAPGRYRLTMQSGSDKGCVYVTFPHA